MKMNWKMIKNISLWVFLNCLIVMCMDLALFTQTTAGMKDASFIKKLLSAEFWASVQWMFAIPANRLGNLFLNPAQIGLSSYIFDFLAQLWSNKFWLKLTTSLDDYIGMVIIFLGMVVSKLRLFG